MLRFVTVFLCVSYMCLVMVRQDRPLNTRVSPETYKALLQKCADGGCSTYEYLRQLVHIDVGIGAEAVPEEPKKEKTLMDLIKNE